MPPSKKVTTEDTSKAGPTPPTPTEPKVFVTKEYPFMDPDEVKRLSADEADELSSLRFRCYTDLPFGRADMGRMGVLDKKAWGE